MEELLTVKDQRRVKVLKGERRLLQIAIAVAACVPVAGGFAGVLGGPAIFGPASGSIDSDSHFRYLSGLLLGLGLTFWWLVPRIEVASAPVRILTGLVVTGGLGRLISLSVLGLPSAGMVFALNMELAVTPLLCLWQSRVAKLAARPDC